MNWGDISIVTAPIASLGGVWLGAWLQRGDKNIDRLERRNDLLRTKAEAIYEEMDQAFVLTAEARMCALLQKYDKPIEGMHSAPANMGRLKALTQMYFPASADIWTKYAERIRPLLVPFDDSSFKGTDIQKLAAMREYSFEFASKMFEATAATLGELRLFMDDQVKSLI